MYVYIIQAGNRCKIGKARDPERRVAELQTGNPHKLELLACIPCKSDRHAFAVEKLAHQFCAPAATRGEWFQYTRQIHRLAERARAGADQREQVYKREWELDREFWRAIGEG